MCLSTIAETYEEPSTMIMSGLKVFKGSTSTPEFENQFYKGSKKVPLDVWIKAEGTSLGFYPAGFHVFEADSTSTSQQSSYWDMKKARRVYMRKVHTKGTQDGMTIYVAEEIYVPSNPDAWPPKGNEPVPEKKGIRKLFSGGSGGTA